MAIGDWRYVTSVNEATSKDAILRHVRYRLRIKKANSKSWLLLIVLVQDLLALGLFDDSLKP